MPTTIETGIREVDPRHGLDAPRIEALETWLRERLEDFDGRLEVRQFEGGQSNPTYLLCDGEREWVLRRKPPGKLVSSAHATDREFRVLSALAKVDFPVPRVRGYCDDASVLGSEFYVMDRVRGRILVDQTLPAGRPTIAPPTTPRSSRRSQRSTGSTSRRSASATTVSRGTTSRGRSASGAASTPTPVSTRASGAPRWSG